MKAMSRALNRVIRVPLLVGLFAGASVWAQKSALAAEYYVAPTGSDSAAGTLAAPFATLQKGADVAVAGDTVYIRGGTYEITTPKNSGAGLTFSKSGTSDTNRIKYWAYQSEVPVFDFANMVLSTSGYTHGFVVTGSWLHFRGLELRNVPMNTFSNNAIAANGGGNCIFELLNLHHNSGNGIIENSWAMGNGYIKSGTARPADGNGNGPAIKPNLAVDNRTS